MNPQRARELWAEYQILETAYGLNPDPSTHEQMGRKWNQLRQELLHQTGRTERRDTRAFGDPAFIYERRNERVAS